MSHITVEAEVYHETVDYPSAECPICGFECRAVSYECGDSDIIDRCCHMKTFDWDLKKDTWMFIFNEPTDSREMKRARY